MDTELHVKYKNTKLSDDAVEMFYEIINQDKVLVKVFQYIAIEQKNQSELGTPTGITINDIVEHVTVERLERQDTGKRSSYKYQQTHTHIHRKTAEKLVDKLLFMSLLYYKPVKPYKFLYLTQRGTQVLMKIVEHKNAEKSKGDE